MTIDDLRKELHTQVIGQTQAAQSLLIALLAGGHVLVEGVPGIGKTLLAKTMARALGLAFARVQFTPDLLPSDVTGSVLYDYGQASFRVERGPVFTHILLADEINRTPPKTQAALLEAMEEAQVTIYGQTLALPQPFFVIATQNPIEYEGTYPLPEAQLDRFLLKVQMSYPSLDDECTMLQKFQPRTAAAATESASEPLPANPEHDTSARKWQQQVAAIAAADSVTRYIAQIVARTRTVDYVRVGASPRAGTALLMASKAAAFLADRTFVTPDDVKQMVLPVLAHRVLLTPSAELEGVTADVVLKDILAQVEVPQ